MAAGMGAEEVETDLEAPLIEIRIVAEAHELEPNGHLDLINAHPSGRVFLNDKPIHTTQPGVENDLEDLEVGVPVCGRVLSHTESGIAEAYTEFQAVKGEGMNSNPAVEYATSSCLRFQGVLIRLSVLWVLLLTLWLLCSILAAVMGNTPIEPPQ